MKKETSISKQCLAFCERLSPYLRPLMWVSLLIIPAGLLGSTSKLQDTPFRTRMGIECTQFGSGEFLIEVRLRARVDRQYEAIEKASIQVLHFQDTGFQLLQSGQTDADGFVRIELPNLDQLHLDEDGYYSITATYTGDESYESAEENYSWKPSRLDMELIIGEDSSKTVKITAYGINGTETPIGEAEVFLMVPRMFSDLPIGDAYTEEDGTVEFSFPSDLPGDKNGEIIVKAKIEDLDEYASMENESQINWGIPTMGENHQDERALWTPNAPFWMVATFVFLMTLVWGHLLIIMIKLHLIKRAGKLEST